jgi:gentisate 1,2-dioxygenase
MAPPTSAASASASARATPSSCPHGRRCGWLSASEDSVLFSFSDRPVQQAMGILREAFLQDT